MELESDGKLTKVSLVLDKKLTWGLFAALVCLCLLLGACTFFVLQGREAIVSFERSPDLVVLHDLLQQLHKPCQGSGADKQDNCGTIALVNQDLVNLGVLVKHSDKIEADEQKVLEVRVPVFFDALQLAVNNAGGATAALTTTFSKAGELMDQTKTSVKQDSDATAGVMNATTKAIGDADVPAMKNRIELVLDDVHGLTSNPHIPSLLAESDGILGSTNQILARGYLVEKKATQCYLNPTFRCVAGGAIKGVLVPGVQIGGAIAAAAK